MISQKTYLIFLLTGIVAIAGSIGQASAQQPNYPSMQRFDSAAENEGRGAAAGVWSARWRLPR